MAAETILFPRTGYGGIMLTNLKVIWDMSVHTKPLPVAGKPALEVSLCLSPRRFTWFS
jgi:hypothetical protein